MGENYVASILWVTASGTIVIYTECKHLNAHLTKLLRSFPENELNMRLFTTMLQYFVFNNSRLGVDVTNNTNIKHQNHYKQRRHNIVGSLDIKINLRRVTKVLRRPQAVIMKLCPNILNSITEPHSSKHAMIPNLFQTVV